VNGVVVALAASGSSVYVGGGFTSIGARPQLNLAGLSASASTLDAPEAAATSFFALGVAPNPVRVRGVLRFTLPGAGAVSLALFDPAGRCVGTLIDREWTMAGTHEVMLRTAGLTPGLYFARLRSGARIATQKLMVIGD
jgi:hypothetical protein